MVTTDQASRVASLLEEAGRAVLPVAELQQPPPAGAIGLVHGSSGGFPRAVPLQVLTDRELFGATRPAADTFQAVDDPRPDRSWRSATRWSTSTTGSRATRA